MRRLLPLAAVLGLLAVPSGFATSDATPKLAGTTMDPMTITLKRAGTKVTRLKRGKYAITVTDRSPNHDFWITGPGLRPKRITGLTFVGRRTVTVTLARAGRYEFYCLPHRQMGMRGFFRVT